MTKRILFIPFIFFGLAILWLTTACQTKSTPTTALKVEPAVAKSLDQASSTLNLDENAIIAILADKNKQDKAKYELHDVKISGNYAVGRWSIDGQLALEIFWASKDNSSWRLVYVGKDMPACEQLSAWPAEIKAGCRDNLNNKQISNFSQCVTAGGQTEETKPRRCSDDHGNVFVEVTAGGVDKRYISQDLNKCPALDFDCAVKEKRFMDNLGCGCRK